MATSVTGTGSISSAGIGSGLDVSSIVTSLMAVEQRPLTQLQTQATQLAARLSTVGKMQGYFSALQTRANALTSPALWSSTLASSSDSAAVKVSTGSNATPGNYSVAVSRLALGQTVSSSALASSSSTLGAGTLTIELGRYDGGPPPTSFTAGAAPISLAIGPGESSLGALRDKINAADAGVTATLMTDASGTRLSLRSKDTGAENAFRIGVAEAGDDGNPATGLSALAFDATDAGSPMLRTASAGNAELTVNGIALSSASNTLSNVVDGLTLSLQKTTTGDVDVNVAADTASVKGALTGFVEAFNTLASFIRSQTAYNADNKTSGALQGDQATLALQSQLRAVLNEGSSASATWSRLSEIGLALKSDGTLETSAPKLDNALGNLGELKKLLASDGATSASSGFARRFKRLSDAALGTDGVFQSRTDSIQASVSRNSKSQDSMQRRLALTEARMRAQYSALDTTMASLNSLSSYMTQQIAQSNKRIV